MIEIQIKVDKGKVMGRVKITPCTLGETALASYTLDRIKTQLLEKEFDDDLLIEVDDGL